MNILRHLSRLLEMRSVSRFFFIIVFLFLWVLVEIYVFKTRANLSRIRRWFVGFIICHFLNKSFVSFELYELVCDKNVNTNKRKSTLITVSLLGFNTLLRCKKCFLSQRTCHIFIKIKKPAVLVHFHRIDV